jgi:hypothetical protein
MATAGWDANCGGSCSWTSLLALRRLPGVRGKRGDVDQPGDAVIRSCGRDDASAVGVANKDGWAADPSQRPPYRGDVPFGCLRRNKTAAFPPVL